MNLVSPSIILLFLLAGLVPQARAGEPEPAPPNGQSYSLLWLDYQPLPPALRTEWSGVARSAYCPESSPILRNARDEWIAAAGRMTQGKVTAVTSINGDGTVVMGTLDQLRELLPAPIVAKVETLKDEGYVIESAILQGRRPRSSPHATRRGFSTGHFICCA